MRRAEIAFKVIHQKKKVKKHRVFDWGLTKKVYQNKQNPFWKIGSSDNLHLNFLS